MTWIVFIVGHGDAEILATDGSRVVFATKSASPPGSSLSCSVEGMARPFRVKVSSCRRADDPSTDGFRVEGRLVDLTRDEREALVSKAQGGST